MVLTPSWLKFKKWRSKGASPPVEARLESADIGSASLPSLAGNHQASSVDNGQQADERPVLQLISEQQLQPRPLNPASRNKNENENENEDRDAGDHEAEPKAAATTTTTTTANSNNNQEATSTSEQPAERGRTRTSNRNRLCVFVPRVLSNFIERAISPNVRHNKHEDQRERQQQQAGHSTTARPKSPLRKFHKHFKQKQEPPADKRQTKAPLRLNRAPNNNDDDDDDELEDEQAAANLSPASQQRLTAQLATGQPSERPAADRHEPRLQRDQAVGSSWIRPAVEQEEKGPAKRPEISYVQQRNNEPVERARYKPDGAANEAAANQQVAAVASERPNCDPKTHQQNQHLKCRQKATTVAAADTRAPPIVTSEQAIEQWHVAGKQNNRSAAEVPNSSDRMDDKTETVAVSTPKPVQNEERLPISGLAKQRGQEKATCSRWSVGGAKSPLCQLTARTRDNQCALHGSNVALCRLADPVNATTSNVQAVVELAQSTTASDTRAAPQSVGAPAGNELASAATVTSGATTTTATSPTEKQEAHEAITTETTPTTTTKTTVAAKTRRPPARTPKDKARSVSTWPLAKQTLDNNLPNEFRLGHFGDCEDLLSAHLAGRLFGALTAFDLIIHQASKSIPVGTGIRRAGREMIANDQHHRGRGHHHHLAHAIAATTSNTAAVVAPFDQLVFQATSDELRLVDQLRAFNYNHKRPFAQPYESPTTGWLFNATGLQPINSGSARALRAKLFVSNKFRRRSYDDQEGDNDINIILQPSDIDDIEKRARAGYARLKASTVVETSSSSSLVAATTTTTIGATNDEKHQHNQSNNQQKKKKQQQHKQRYKLKAFEGIFEDIKLAKCLLDQDYNQTVRLFIERSALNWNFNSFTFDALCCGKSLTELLLHLFDYYNLYAIFNLDIIKVLKCFRLLEFGYHSTNPYHNSVHAADVTQAMHCFIQENKIRGHLTDLEILCSILAAVCHDLDHPGVNQSFLVATNNPLASLYHNNSVLENHHWRFALCIFKESELFDHFDCDVLDNMKQQLKQLILATDIARQNDYLKRFKALTSSKQFSMSNTDDRALVLQMALKCADLGNPCRPWLISRVWSNLICDEFYRMGQIERRLGVPLTPICQRDKTSIAGIQTDFFRFIVLPLLELWHNFLSSPLSNLLMSNFDHNYQRWQRANRIVQQLRRRKSVASLEPVKDVEHDDQVDNRHQDDYDCQRDWPHLSKQARSSSVFRGPMFELGPRRDSFELIKRASSDYIKSGNGMLESLRDFQLNRIIEKSPVISRATRFVGAKRRASRLAAAAAAAAAAATASAPTNCDPIDAGCAGGNAGGDDDVKFLATGNWKTTPIQRGAVGLKGGARCNDRQVGRQRNDHQLDERLEEKCDKIDCIQDELLSNSSNNRTKIPTTTTTTTTTTNSPTNQNTTTHRHQVLSPIEDHDGASPEVIQCDPRRAMDKQSSESLSSSPRSQASSTSSSPVMKRSISSRTSIDQQRLLQQHKSSTNFPLHESSKFKLSSTRQSLSHTSKSIYNNRRRESDPGCLTENYELAAAIVLLQYKSGTIFQRRNSFD